MNRMLPPLCTIILTAVSGCSNNHTEFSILLAVPTEEVVKQTDYGTPMVNVQADGDGPMDPPLNRAEFKRGETRTVKVVVRNRPPKFGIRYTGKVEVVLEAPAGITVKPDRVTIDLDKNAEGAGWTSGAAHEVSLEVAADAAPGKLKLTARPLDPIVYTHTSEISFGVR